MSKYKGRIADFPEEVVEKMLEYQEKQGNLRDVSVFEKYPCHASPLGFDWDKTDKTVEGLDFWFDVIICKKFDLFFSIYPKKKEELIYKVGDKVYHWNYGNGEIIFINLEDKHKTISVQFPKGIAYFSKDGYLYANDSTASLSFTPYSLVNGGFSQERPLPNLKKGDLIWVRHKGGEWLYKRFLDWENKKNRTVTVSDQYVIVPIGVYSEWSIECPIK